MSGLIPRNYRRPCRSRPGGRRRRIDRKEQQVLARQPVEPVEHNLGLDPRPLPLGINRDHPVEMFAAIDDERPRHGPAALRGAGTGRRYRHPLLAGNCDRRRGIFAALRHDPQRLDLVDRRVGRVAPAAESIEQHLAPDLAPQTRLQIWDWVTVDRHAFA